MSKLDIEGMKKDLTVMFQRDDNYYKNTDGPWRWEDNKLSTDKSKGDKWQSWGKDNLYPDMLLFYSDNSPILKGILKKEYNRIAGSSIVYESTGEPIDDRHPLYFTSNGVRIDEFISLLSVDTSYLNTFAFTIEYTKGKDKVSRLYHIPAKTIRSGKQLKSTGEVSKYFISPDWCAVNSNKIEPKSVQAYNVDKLYGTPQLFYSKSHNLRDYYYSEIGWDAALNYAILDYEIGVFHKSHVKNGLVPGLVISFPNETSPQRMQQIKKTFDDRLKGAGNAGKAVFLFAPTPDSLPKIDVIQPSDLDKQFELLNSQINEKIVLATGIPRILSGIETATGLADTGNALRLAEEMWFMNDIVHKQNRIQKAINEICDISGYDRISITNPKASFLDYGLSDAIIQTSFSINEIRQAAGMSPVDGGDEVLKNDNTI